MRHITKSCLVFSAAMIVTVGTISLSGCSIPVDLITHRQTVEYKSAEDMHRDNDAPVDRPRWVPEDATDIRITNRTDGPGYMVRFVSPTRIPVLEGCSAVGADVAQLEPAISDDGWPQKLPQTDRQQCDGVVEIAREGNNWYLWRAAD
ncbi:MULTISPECIES: hypothetical protein [Bacteria]|uniref:hypothetical protein n=1 Tax=Bacteria TaxID=2 RepID=UPI003C7B1A3D